MGSMQTPPEIQPLVNRARRNATRAHAPYSRYAVGSVVETEDGSIFDGANLENAAYPLGCCAERVALSIWRSRSGRRIANVVVWTESDPPAPPCGLCRDALLAWAPDAPIWLAGPTGVRGPLTPRSLVPMAEPNGEEAR